MGTIFAHTYANLTMEYTEIKVHSSMHQSYALANKNQWIFTTNQQTQSDTSYLRQIIHGIV